MIEKTMVSHAQMLEAMDKLMSHRLAASAMLEETPEETSMRQDLLKKIDLTYNALLERMQGYTPDP